MNILITCLLNNKWMLWGEVSCFNHFWELKGEQVTLIVPPSFIVWMESKPSKPSEMLKIKLLWTSTPCRVSINTPYPLTATETVNGISSLVNETWSLLPKVYQPCTYQVRSVRAA